MSKKNLISVSLLVITLSLITFCVYVFLNKETLYSYVFKNKEKNPIQEIASSTDTQNQNPSIPISKIPNRYKDPLKDLPEYTQWNDLLPKINKMLVSQFPLFAQESEYENLLSAIQKIEDINGDETKEAFVYGQGGASNSSVVIFTIENKQPKFIEFKQKNEKISPMIIYHGASSMHGEGLETIPSRKIIYTGKWAIEDELPITFESCTVEAYQWNDITKIFEFSSLLSNEIEPIYCENTLNLITQG